MRKREEKKEHESQNIEREHNLNINITPPSGAIIDMMNDSM